MFDFLEFGYLIGYSLLKSELFYLFFFLFNYLHFADFNISLLFFIFFSVFVCVSSSKLHLKQ